MMTVGVVIRYAAGGLRVASAFIALRRAATCARPSSPLDEPRHDYGTMALFLRRVCYLVLAAYAALVLLTTTFICRALRGTAPARPVC